MLIALDEKNNRISAEASIKGNEYFCPICKRKLNVCKGEVKIPYFAHQAKKSCIDSWKYDMSDWHREMQLRFPEEQREVVVTYAGETHRADILCGNKVLEFQHSPITATEIKKRNEFYSAAGYQVAWIFDMDDLYGSSALSFSFKEDKNQCKWKRPKACLRAFPIPAEYKADIVLYFYWRADWIGEQFNKVIWSSNDNGIPDFRVFWLKTRGERISNPPQVDDFFVTNRERLFLHLKTKGYHWNVKFCNVRGYREHEYTCPKTGKFGLKKYGEDSCRKCKYCAAVYNRVNGFEAYCCFPKETCSLQKKENDDFCVPEF